MPNTEATRRTEAIERTAFVNAIFAKAAEIAMDQAGRAVLTPNLLKAAGIEKDLLFVGAMDRFQIWNPERYAAYDAEQSDYAANNQDALAAPFYQAEGMSGPGGLS